MKNDTCVYIHTRSDNVVFYVGIGLPKRPNEESGRNKHWHSITAKYGYTVTILHQNLTWEQACAIEIELIKKYRSISGNKLCNITDGGDVGSKGMTHSEEARKKIAEATRNRSPETRAKISKSNKGKILSEETKLRMREANVGQTRSEETRAKLRTAWKTRAPIPPLSEEHRARISASLKGNLPSPETRLKLSLAAKNRWNAYHSKEALLDDSVPTLHTLQPETVPIALT